MSLLKKKKLGDMLLEIGKITPVQLDRELKRQKASGKRLGEMFVEDQIITEDELLDILESQLGIKRVNLENYAIDENIVKSIPEVLARKYLMVPVSFRNNKVDVVMSDPLNIFALDDVQISSGFEANPLIASKEEIIKAIDKYYSSSYVEKAAEELKKEQLANTESKEEKESNELDDVKNAPIVKLVDSIIDNAVKDRASDIHVEPFENYIKIRYRIDGELQEVLKLPAENKGAFTTRVKILANLNIAERRLPQDGRIITMAGNQPVDLRVSVLPTVHGEKIVIRILKRNSYMLSMDKLGLQEDDQSKMAEIIKSTHGIVLVTGPTGSGKSTTLYTILSQLNSNSKNIVTVEDPVEYTVEGVNQVSVNTKAGLTFASGLRSILRQDPDIVMIGEIRDGETAEIAVRAAITGHLVLSTLHTNDAPSTVVRLVDMGIEPYLIATSIAGIIAQRLVRKICTSCVEEYEASQEEKKILGINPFNRVVLHRGRGCKVCKGTGYMGRQGVYEIMEINREIREAIMSGMNSDKLMDLGLKNGMKTLKNACIEAVLNGTTTVEELIKTSYSNEEI